MHFVFRVFFSRFVHCYHPEGFLVFNSIVSALCVSWEPPLLYFPADSHLPAYMSPDRTRLFKAYFRCCVTLHVLHCRFNLSLMTSFICPLAATKRKRSGPLLYISSDFHCCCCLRASLFSPLILENHFKSEQQPLFHHLPTVLQYF